MIELILIFVLIIGIRNNMVYFFRTKILKKDYKLYMKLPSYGYMLFDLRIWNFNKYIEVK